MWRRYTICEFNFALVWAAWAAIAGMGGRTIDNGPVTRSKGGRFLNKFCFG
jgi:hypothetical protein